MEVGRGSRGNVLLDNALMAFRTSIGDTGGSVEKDAPENCLGGKDEVDDEARVLAIDWWMLSIFDMKKVFILLIFFICCLKILQVVHIARYSVNSSIVFFFHAEPSREVLMRVSLIAEACVSLRLTLELFYLDSCVTLLFRCLFQ